MSEEKVAWTEYGLEYLENGELTEESKKQVEPFEREYKKAWDEAIPHLNEIAEAMSYLKQISEKYGIPMDFGISEINNNPYFPGNTLEKFPNLPEEWIFDRCNVRDPNGNEVLDYNGWQRSDAAC